MPKQVLDVGQCQPDHAAISRFIRQNFDADVVQTDGAEDTLQELRTRPYDLVLINRKLDADYSDGLEILKRIKADAALASVPVMLVSNYPDQQQIAMGAGALCGFGKAELHLQETAEKVRQVLAR